jgi:integrase/recombinase XerD
MGTPPAEPETEDAPVNRAPDETGPRGSCDVTSGLALTASRRRHGGHLHVHHCTEGAAARAEGRAARGRAPGLSSRTIKRRLASISELFGYLATRDDLAVARNPVPTGLANRRRGDRRGAPPLRTPRTLPRVLGPEEVEAVLGSVNTARDRAMVLAMLLGGLRRCEVLGLRLGDLSPGERRVFVAEGKGGHQRLIPISGQFFTAVGDYLDRERPAVDHDQLFVVLRGSTRGGPLSAAGLDEIVDGVRKRAGLPRLTCHQLRHTCLTRLREAGMALEAVQAQAGHRSIEPTRIYIHLANAWLVEQYLDATAAIDAAAIDVDGSNR